MCKAYPGPRCSNHTRIALEAAHENLQAALQTQDPDKVSEALLNVDEKQQEYDATPEGLETLGKKIDNAIEAGDAPEATYLRGRLDEAELTREKAKAAYKKYQQTGKLPPEEPKEEDGYNTFELVGLRQGRRFRANNAIREYNEKKAEEARQAYAEEARIKASTPEELERREAAAFAHARTDLHSRAAYARINSGRDWEGMVSTPTDIMDGIETTVSDSVEMTVSSITAKFNRNNPRHANSKSRNRIHKQLRNLEKETRKLQELEQSAGDNPEDRERIQKVKDGLNKQSTALRYDLDLLATEPRHGEHPKIAQDRELAVRRWNLTGAIDKLLA